MTETNREKLQAELLAANLDGSDERNNDVPERHEQIDLEPLMQVADLLWESAHGAPALENDPVAQMLGLVPDPVLRVEPRTLARLRKNAKLTPSEVAERLSARGWEVNTRQVFGWETNGASSWSPALLGAVASVLNVDVEQLANAKDASNSPEWLERVTSSPPFRELSARWATLKGIPESLASAALTSRLVATVHRGGRPEPDQLLASLGAFVDSMESAGKDTP